MLSVERVKTLLGDPKVSEKEAEKIRDAFRLLAEVIFEKWQEQKGRRLEQSLSPKSGLGYNRDVDPPQA